MLEISPWTHLLTDQLDWSCVINALVCLAHFLALLDSNTSLSFKYDFDFWEKPTFLYCQVWSVEQAAPLGGNFGGREWGIRGRALSITLGRVGVYPNPHPPPRGHLLCEAGFFWMRRLCAFALKVTTIICLFYLPIWQWEVRILIFVRQAVQLKRETLTIWNPVTRGVFDEDLLLSSRL